MKIYLSWLRVDVMKWFMHSESPDGSTKRARKSFTICWLCRAKVVGVTSSGSFLVSTWTTMNLTTNKVGSGQVRSGRCGACCSRRTCHSGRTIIYEAQQWRCTPSICQSRSSDWLSLKLQSKTQTHAHAHTHNVSNHFSHRRQLLRKDR